MARSAIDGRTIARAAELTCDICIVGAGPIGLTTALEFVNTRHDVILLESGGMSVGTERNELSELAKGAFHGPNDHITANRRFGGNSSVWIQILTGGRLGVRFGEFQPADFEERPDIANSGWPISYDDLAPYARRVAEHWQLDPDGFKAEAYCELGHEPFTAIPHFETSVYQFPDATVPREIFRAELEAAANIRIIHHATATKVIDEADGQPAKLDVRTARDHAFTVSAKRIILAGGAMATTQLLLHSPSGHGHMLGNAHDVVGRYLMDHPLLRGGDLILKDPAQIEAFKLYDNRGRGTYHSQGYFHPTDTLLRERDEVLNLNMFFLPRQPGYLKETAQSDREKRVHNAAVHAKLALQRKHLPDMKDILTAMTGPDVLFQKIYKRFFAPHYNLGRGGWSEEKGLAERYDRFEVIQYAEQLPHAENRLYLSDEEDELGMKRIQFDFKLHDSDRRRFKSMQRLMARSVKESGLGILELAYPEDDLKLDMIAEVIGHYLGTTRMGSDPKTSVVDANCKVHGTEAIFVASTSTFTTGGTSNPTLTGLSLGLRIADHLKSDLSA